MDKEILIDIVVSLVTAILGFFGGCHFEKNKSKQKITGDNYGNVAGRNIKNVHKEKQIKTKNNWR